MTLMTLEVHPAIRDNILYFTQHKAKYQAKDGGSISFITEKPDCLASRVELQDSQPGQWT